MIGRGRGRSQGRGGRGQQGHGGSSEPLVPTTVLSLHQPLASMLAYGLQRIEGRSWAARHRGPLWIHAASKEPTPEDIEDTEEFYGRIHALDSDGERELVLPPAYPTSCLLGLVEVIDCVTAEQFDTWSSLPHGLQLEATGHGRGYFFLVERHQRLGLPLQMGGQHKLWQLDHATAKGLLEGGLLPSEQLPRRFAALREEAAQQQHALQQAARPDAAGLPPSAPTPSQKKNQRRAQQRALTAAAAANGATLAQPSSSSSAAAAVSVAAPPAPIRPLLRYQLKDGTVVELPAAEELSGHFASASSPAVAEYQLRLAAAQLGQTARPEAVARSLGRDEEWAARWCVARPEDVPRPRELPGWLPAACFRDVELQRGFVPPEQAIPAATDPPPPASPASRDPHPCAPLPPGVGALRALHGAATVATRALPQPQRPRRARDRARS